MREITIFMRDGGIWVSEIDEASTPITIGQRMTSGGFIVCADSRWGRRRELVINASDISSVVLNELDTEVKK